MTKGVLVQATCDTHLFGSRGGYRTVASSSGVSAQERAELEIFGFGQLSDRRGQQALLARASAFGRRLSSGRFAVTRILPGPDDDGGRPTLELRTVLLDRASYGAIAASGIALLIDTGAVWSAAAFAEGRSMSLAVGPRRAIETREIHRRLADAWLSVRTSPQQMIRVDDADGARILELATLLDPSDLDELRWGVGVLSTAVPVDLFTLAPIGSGSGRRPVRDLPKSGAWVHASVASLPEQGPWPPLRNARIRSAPVMVDRSHGGPETWTYDGPMPTRPRKGPDRRVILAGAAILVIGLGAILAMLLFKRAEPPTRSQEFARVPASSGTGGSRATDGTESDSGGHAAADASPNRQEKIPAPGKGMGFPATPPAGGTARESGTPSTEQGASAGGGDQSASPPPSKPEPDDSSQKTDADGTVSGGATPPSAPIGESTASKPIHTDSANEVMPTGATAPATTVGQSGSNEQVDPQGASRGTDVGGVDEDWCDCKQKLTDPSLHFPRPPDLGRPKQVSTKLHSLDQAITDIERGVAAMERIDLQRDQDKFNKIQRQFKESIEYLHEGFSTARSILVDENQRDREQAAKWILGDIVVMNDELAQPELADQAQEFLISYNKTVAIESIKPALHDCRRRLDNLMDLDAWLSVLAIHNAPEAFRNEQQSEQERLWRDHMISYLCRLKHFVTRWVSQPTRLGDNIFSRERWADFVASRMPEKSSRHGTQDLYREIDAAITRSGKDTVVNEQVIISQMQDGLLEWTSRSAKGAGDETRDCIERLVISLFPKVGR